jgi:hypothetical protein
MTIVIKFTESVVEDAALAWLESLGYTVKHGPEIEAKAIRGAARPLWEGDGRAACQLVQKMH